MRLSQAVQGYLLAKRTRLADTTMGNYRRALTRLANALGDPDLDAVTPATLRGYVDQMAADGLSRRSVRDNFAIASAFWKWAAGELGVANPTASIKLPKHRDAAIEPYTDGEIRAMTQAAQWTSTWHGRAGKPARSKRPTADRDIAIILTLLDSGLRASELCALELRDYNSEQGRLFVRHGKGDKARAVFIGASAQNALWRYLASRTSPRDTDPLFATRGGRPIHRANLLHHLQRIGERAGVAGVTVHRFRHTCAIQFLRNGGNVFELQRILGHETLEMSRRYSQLAEVDIAKAQRAHSPADNWRL